MQPWLVPHFSVEASNWKQNRTIKAVASNNYRNMQRTEQHEGLAVSFALENKGTATAEDAYIEYQGTNLFYNAIPIGHAPTMSGLKHRPRVYFAQSGRSIVGGWCR